MAIARFPMPTRIGALTVVMRGRLPLPPLGKRARIGPRLPSATTLIARKKLFHGAHAPTTGCIGGQKTALKRPCEAVLHTDSRYLCDAVEKKWLTNWQKKGWKKADGKPVLNRDLWEMLLPLLARHKVRLRWVEAHVGHAENEEVDTLARQCAGQRDLPDDTGFSG